MKLQTRLLTTLAAFMLAAVVQAAPPPGFGPNAQATLVTNKVQWSLWGPGLTTDGATSGGANSFAELDAMHFGHADLDFGLRTANYYTNNLQGPYNGGAGSFWAGAGDPTTTSYADQFIGVFIPPVTTNYVFFVCSDDFMELYLGTDISAASAQLIAEENTWSNPLQWTASAGGSSTALKRSDQFISPGAVTPQYASGIPLVAGNMYYIEVDHENGNGGYNDSVYYKFAGAPDPLSVGVQTDMTNTPTSQILGFVAQPPTFVNINLSPSNVTVAAGSEAVFNLSVNTDATVATNSVPYAALITWQTNGVTVTNADGTVASGHTFGLMVGASDTGVKVTAQVSLVGDTNIYSGQGTITVTPRSPVVGGLKREFWYNDASGLTDILNFNLGTPNYSLITTNGQGPSGTSINNYTERYSGWFIPPTTGSYVFFVTSDDQSDLFISTDNTPDNKYLIAQETVWATGSEWSTDQGSSVTTGTPVTQKRSDQFVPATAPSAPYTAGIALTAGQQYYIEADHTQGGGGDDFGMTFSLIADANSVTTGVATAFGPANLAYAATVGTAIAITQNPSSATIFEGASATFSVSITANGDLQPQYHWLVNGVDEGPGAVALNNLSSVYSLSGASFSLNGAQIKLVVDLPGTSLTATSTVATLTVQKAVSVPGFLEHQFWANQGSLPSTITPNFGVSASYTNVLTQFDCNTNDGIDNYTQVVSGYFIPPETGRYVFNLCSDDHSDLYLSTDDSGANAKLIAQETAWSNNNQWASSAGSSTLATKESDTFAGADTNGIQLTAGSNYFIAAVMEQGGGGDNLGVYFWTKDGNYPLAADGTPSDLMGTNIAFVTPAASVTLLSSPQSGTILAGNKGTFSVTAASTSTISTAGSTNTFVTYQWYTNNVLVAGATKSQYVTPLLGTNDSGLTLYCVVGAIAASTTNSATATVTVNPDPIAGGAVSAFAVLDSGGAGGEPTNQYVDIIFSKAMDLNSALNPANYSIAGATITGVTVFTNNTGDNLGGNMIVLQLAAPLKGAFTVSMPNVLDFSLHNVTNSTLTGSYDPLTSEDISLAVLGINGTTYYLGPGHYEVDASGVDIWNGNDSFRFVYEPKTGDFDVAVQVPYVAPADQWTKAGLMVRELIDPTDGGSRMMSIEGTASRTLSPAPLDGSTAENQISMGIRETTDGGALSPPTTPTATDPTYYVGDGTAIPVPYPDVWLRLTRTQEGTTNDLFTGYYSNDGQNWTKMCAWAPQDNGDAVAFPSTVYVGMCTTAHINSPGTQLATVIYQNFGDFVPGTVTTGPTVTASASGGNINISWTPTGGTLYSSPTLSSNPADWTVVGTANPYSAPLGSGSLFFKVKE